MNLNFGLLSIAIYRIAQVRYSINKYGINEIWTSMEFSAASGILQEFSNINNVASSNFMHGEKVLTLRDAFCSFNTFYVWTKHHKELFTKLSVRSQVKIENPWSSDKIEELKSDKSMCYFFKGNESTIELNKINSILEKFQFKGYSVSVKLHPRRTLKTDLIKKFNTVNSDKDTFENFN